MTYISCAAKIAANIQQDCNKPLVGGYTGRAVIMSAKDFERAEVVRSASNPRKILSIVLPPNGSVMSYTIDNVFSAPFTGSTTAGNNENGRNGYLKTLSVRVPMRGADTSMKVIEPLVKSADGFVVIMEKRDKVGDGSYEVIGYQNALRGDIAGVTRDESANGGDWIVPLTTVETWAEVSLIGADETYESARNEFECLIKFEPMAIRLHTNIANQSFYALKGSGDVYVDYVKNGVNVRAIFNNPNYSEGGIILENDADTDITIYGDVTHFETFYLAGGTDLTSIDVSKNDKLIELGAGSNVNLKGVNVSNLKELEAISFYDCHDITSIDLTQNTKLKVIYLPHCVSLTSLNVSRNTECDILSINDMPAIILLNLSNLENVTSFDGFNDDDYPVLTTIQIAGANTLIQDRVEHWFENAAVISSGMLYVDENTNQSLITAAEAKGWEVVYVS